MAVKEKLFTMNMGTNEDNMHSVPILAFYKTNDEEIELINNLNLEVNDKYIYDSNSSYDDLYFFMCNIVIDMYNANHVNIGTKIYVSGKTLNMFEDIITHMSEHTKSKYKIVVTDRLNLQDGEFIIPASDAGIGILYAGSIKGKII